MKAQAFVPFPMAGPSRAAGRTTILAGFFGYHGVWAPGVRLFRALQFEETAAAASSLRDQAVDLAGEVAKFKLPDA